MLPSGHATKAMFALMAVLLAASPACADKRIALVIGNAGYTALARLPNPGNEAAEIGEAVKTRGR